MGSGEGCVMPVIRNVNGKGVNAVAQEVTMHIIRMCLIIFHFNMKPNL